MTLRRHVVAQLGKACQHMDVYPLQGKGMASTRTANMTETAAKKHLIKRAADHLEELQAKIRGSGRGMGAGSAGGGHEAGSKGYTEAMHSLESGSVSEKGMGAIGLLLASESLNYYIHQGDLQVMSGMPSASWMNTCRAARALLGLPMPQLTLHDLAIQHGWTGMDVDEAERLMATFERAYAPTLPLTQRESAIRGDLRKDTNFIVVVFFALCKAKKVTLDKKRLVQVGHTTMPKFNKLFKTLQTLCATDLKKIEKEATDSKKRQAKAETTTHTRKRARTEDQKNATDNSHVVKTHQVPISNGVFSMVPMIHYRDTRDYTYYLQWKANVLNRLAA